MENIFYSTKFRINSEFYDSKVEILISSDDSQIKETMPFYTFKEIVDKMNILVKMYSLKNDLENYNSEI